MLRTVFLSLLAGLLLVICAVSLPDIVAQKRRPSGSLSWGPEDIRAIEGKSVNSDHGFLLRLNESGQGVIEVAGSGAMLDESSLLHVRFDGAPAAHTMLIAWRNPQSGDRILHRRITAPSGNSIWLNMAKEGNWRGRARTLGLVFLGPPGGQVVLESIELFAPVFPYTLVSALQAWTDFIPWQAYSINTYPGVNSPGLAPYPVPFAVAVFFASVLVYLAGLLTLREKLPFEWRVVAALFMSCWLLLDLVWHGRLLRQLDVTRDTFAGKSGTQKREAGRDSELFQFISQVNDRLGVAHTRIFVSSTNDYAGMRGAYYLYPGNVFWQRKAPSLPAPEYFREGDHVVLLRPVQARYDASHGVLQYGEKDRLRVELILTTSKGELYRVI